MKIPLSQIDLLEEEMQQVTQILKSGWIMQGAEVEAFENEVAKFCHISNAVATSSGTTALHLALQLIGVKNGDEVIVPSFSFIASANAIHYCGATPVFCDVNPITYNMEPATVANLVTPQTKAILVVHQFGMPCDLKGFSELKAFSEASGRSKIEIIEDAACAIGSQYENQPIGDCRYSQVACLSFHPRKIVTTGEGGMLLTKNSVLAREARILRNHGLNSQDSFNKIGYNYRMTDIHAALGVGQIRRLPEMILRRRKIAEQYYSRLKNHPQILLPAEAEGRQSNFQTFMIRFIGEAAQKRNQIASYLAQEGISTRKSIPPIHHQPCYASIASQKSLPQTDLLSTEGLILPLFNSMNETQVNHVCDCLLKAVNG